MYMYVGFNEQSLHDTDALVPGARHLVFIVQDAVLVARWRLRERARKAADMYREVALCANRARQRTPAKSRCARQPGPPRQTGPPARPGRAARVRGPPARSRCARQTQLRVTERAAGQLALRCDREGRPGPGLRATERAGLVALRATDGRQPGPPTERSRCARTERDIERLLRATARAAGQVALRATAERAGLVALRVTESAGVVALRARTRLRLCGQPI